jgi:hypothetical protein
MRRTTAGNSVRLRSTALWPAPKIRTAADADDGSSTIADVLTPDRLDRNTAMRASAPKQDE